MFVGVHALQHKSIMKLNEKNTARLEKMQLAVASANMVDEMYEQLQSVNLNTLTPVSPETICEWAKLSQKEIVKKVKTFSDFANSISETNHNYLMNHLFVWAKSLDRTNPFTASWLRLLVRRAKMTKKFTLTYQEKSDDKTTTSYEDGAFFARPSVASALGIRTAYNSCEIVRTALSKDKKRQKFINLYDVPAIENELISKGCLPVVVMGVDETKLRQFCTLLGVDIEQYKK